MCLATPCKIIKISGKQATVASKNHDHVADISLLKNPKIGDYIFLHSGMAINKVPKKEAIKILKVIEEFPHDH